MESTAFTTTHIPVVVCPYRYNIAATFDNIASYFFGSEIPRARIKWVPEVPLGPSGSVDFVIAKLAAGSGSDIEDFICVEFQAAGTTGTPWDAVQEFKKTGGFSRKRYNFGINWANEFAKTMMQQVYKKGMVLQSWKKKIVFVLQDVGLEYLKSAYDTSGLREPPLDEDSIHFFILKMVWDDQGAGWWPIHSHDASTDLEGIRKILGGAGEASFPTIEQFKDTVRKKLGGKGRFPGS